MKKQTATVSASNRHPTFFGHPRLCPHCHKQVSTQKGRFVNHGPALDGAHTCPGSGQRVARPTAAPPSPRPPSAETTSR